MSARDPRLQHGFGTGAQNHPYICQGTTEGLALLNKEFPVPVIYGLLTCNTMEQAEMRAGGALGNKGDECAVTAIKMVDYKRRLSRA